MAELERPLVPKVVARKSAPFSIEMDLALATSYIEEKETIEGPLKGGKLTNKHKLAAWERVKGRVNSVAGGNAKTSSQCKDRYRNMVTAITKRRWQVQATGGGSIPPPLTQAQGMIEGTLSKVKLEGIESPVDTFCGTFGADAADSASMGVPEFAVPTQESSACDVDMFDLATVFSMPIGIPNDDETAKQVRCTMDKEQLTICESVPSLKRKVTAITKEEYMERKLQILEEQHALKKRMLLAQARFFELKAEALLKEL